MSIEEAQKVLAIEEQGLAAVRERIGEEFNQAVEAILSCPTRLVITGIGKSGIVGQKISATLNSTGTPSFSFIRWRPCMVIWEWWRHRMWS